MKRYYIYIEDTIGYLSANASYMAKDEEDAITQFINDKLNHFDEDDRRYLFACESPNYVEEYDKWQRECEEEEALWSRPIEL